MEKPATYQLPVFFVPANQNNLSKKYSSFESV